MTWYARRRLIFWSVQEPLRRGLETAILVSTKNQALVIKGWLTDHGIPAEVCDDVPVGVDSPLGKNLLYFFRWLLMPGDPFVVGLLTHSPLRPLITPGCPESMEWKEWRFLLERDGYAAVMEELERRLLRGGTELTDFHRDRLAVWQNEAEQVDEQSVSLDEWIRRMEDLTRREDPAAGIVRIMTIHKSKGLGFDIVILPQIGRDTPFANATHLTHFVKKKQGWWNRRNRHQTAQRNLSRNSAIPGTLPGMARPTAI